MARFKENSSKADILKVLNFYLKYNKYDNIVETLRDFIQIDTRDSLVLNDYEAAIVSKALRFCQSKNEFRLSKEAVKRLELELAIEPGFYYEVFGIESQTKPCRSVVNCNKSLGPTSLSTLLSNTEIYVPIGRSIN